MDTTTTTTTTTRTAWRVYRSPDGCAEDFCGEFPTRAAATTHAETEPAGTPEWEWESHRRAGGSAALLAPDPAGTLADAESWHWHCVVPVYY